MNTRKPDLCQAPVQQRAVELEAESLDKSYTVDGRQYPLFEPPGPCGLETNTGTHGPRSRSRRLEPLKDVLKRLGYSERGAIVTALTSGHTSSPKRRGGLEGCTCMPYYAASQAWANGRRRVYRTAIHAKWCRGTLPGGGGSIATAVPKSSPIAKQGELRLTSQSTSPKD